MAATISPAPASFSTTDHRRHPIASTARAPMRANNHHNAAKPAYDRPRPTPTRPTTADSSDDEDLAPIKLSAEAQAILGEDNFRVDPAHGKEQERAREEPKHVPMGRNMIEQRLGSHEAGASIGAADGSPAPRVVRISSQHRPNPLPIIGRDGSFMYKIHDRSTIQTQTELKDSRTPAPRLRRVRISGSRSQTNSPPSAKEAAPNQESPKPEHVMSPEEPDHKRSPGDDGLAGPSTIMRPRRTDENGIHSTTRVRRIGTGSFLNGPVRRGMIRRHSQEDEEEQQQDQSYSPEIQVGRRAREPDLEDIPDDLKIYEVPPKQTSESNNVAAPPEREHSLAKTVHSAEGHTSPPKKASLSSLHQAQPTPAAENSASGSKSSKSSGSTRRPAFKLPSLPALPPDHDKENDPPPTFRRTKPAPAILEIHEDMLVEKHPPLAPTAPVSPCRPALAPRSNNTPHRPAPAPPPKMSLIEAATSNASSRNKKTVHYQINDRMYRRLDCIGRGGSSRVFRIMAENYKIFALKRVNLEEADMAAIQGYKGEIDLLKKLENVDRVIRLFDYEINEEKGVLSVIMELGESDFNKMLNEQLKGDNAKFDATFTRHYWKEMLECVQAVHSHEIVHSDLKPANFLLVKGQLKLIDFGIANAIQDNTINVHRENQIGTPNYMSPESLIDQARLEPSSSTSLNGGAATKDIRIGKPSDVWSLGCILYQMTYGQPPFAHIAKQFERIMSIPNPKVEILFPPNGIGGAVVPFGLIKTLRRCLAREQTLRPTIKELLSDTDPFLNPVSISTEMLGRVIGNVIGYCRRKEEGLVARGELKEGMSCLPKEEEWRAWPEAFYGRLRQAMEEGTAW